MIGRFWRVIGTTLLCTTLVLSFTPAESQQPPLNRCGWHKQVVDNLKKQYNEDPVWRGLQGELALELFAAPDHSTWSMAAVQPNGFTCLISHGNGWHHVAPPDHGKPT